ncbi:hypothetical protein Bca52824_044500 [Brassica carinata]|uniref:RING-type E3 ubiquitin transferase n=1 Tax=Brassica carinata TaxID=52824 RepID=A0A8X7UPB5_BRACI|nr:hypothetical protein Bca52824_044500 [Brassica carinata]
MSGTFLVHNIDYYKQQIYISDPENCLAKWLLTFNMSGSPFSSRFSTFYTFFSCPNYVALPYSYRSIPCLNNSTSSFYATTNYAFVELMLPSCQIVKRLHVPHTSPSGEIEFSSYVGNQSLMLEWLSPNCRSCEMDNVRCGFKKKSSLEVKCFGSKEPGHLSSGVLAVIISFSIIGAVTLLGACIAIRVYNSPRRGHSAIAAAATVRQQPRDYGGGEGLDQSTIETYKKVELGESRRLPGTNEVSSIEWEAVKMSEEEEDLISRMYKLVGDSILQARKPYSRETLDYIRSLNAEEDINLLKFHGWKMPLKTARTLRISTMLLKKGAERGLTAFEIGNMMCRDSEQEISSGGDGRGSSRSSASRDERGCIPPSIV